MSAHPDWFTAALGQRPEFGRVAVAGASVVYRAWGLAGRPGAILIHGGSAHSGWWDHIGPLLATQHRVVAVDLTGHGDSDRRSGYDLDTWADEVLAAATDAAIGARPILIGHSMGGFVALRAGATRSDQLAGIVVVDTPVRPFSSAEQAERDRRAAAAPRRYPDRASAVGRFRPIPDQGRPLLDYVVTHVAEQSVRREADGWTWKYDPRTYGRRQLGPEDVEPVACRALVMRAEHGRLTPELAGPLRQRMGANVAEVVLPDAGHHVMLDRPLVLIAALGTVLAEWAAG